MAAFFRRLAVLVLLLSGCSGFPAALRPGSPKGRAAVPPAASDAESTARAAESAGDRAVLAAQDWIHAVQAPGAGAKSAYRWRYPALEELLARPLDRRPDFRRSLRDADAVVAANAAIALARLGDPAGAERLTEAVWATHIKLEMRCAAAEALASLDGPAAVRPLEELLDWYGRCDPQGQTAYLPELHAELIRGLARHVDAGRSPHFLAALRSPAAEVRLAAVAAWSAGREGSLPVELADLRDDPEARVRAAVLDALVSRRHPQAEEYATAALDDYQLEVRCAAIAALGRLGTEHARATLQLLLESRHEAMRAAAVAALRQCGAQEAVLHAAGDKAAGVRAVAAAALADYPNREGAAMAVGLLSDPSPAVQMEVICAVARWPPALSGPVLMEAMAGEAYAPRKAAAGQLAAEWPPAQGFPVDAPRPRRAEAIARLREQFAQQVGLLDKQALAAAVRAAPAEPTPPRQIEQTGPAFAALDGLSSQDLRERRAAAAELARLAADRPLSPAATERLAVVAAAEPDPIVWQDLLAAVATDSGEAAGRLAHAAMSHPSPEVRRRACEHLAAHPDPSHIAVLLPALDDPSEVVVAAALRALGAAGRLDDTAPIRRLLARPNEHLRLEAAAALTRLGDAAGPPALERLAQSGDYTVRRQAAVAMGELADPQFASTLLRLLEDGQESVCLAALESLPAVVGEDVGQPPGENRPGTTERIRRWRQWQELRNGMAENRPCG